MNTQETASARSERARKVTEMLRSVTAVVEYEAATLECIAELPGNELSHSQTAAICKAAHHLRNDVKELEEIQIPH